MIDVRTPPTVVLGAAAASVSAALVHAAAAGTHAGAPELVRLFAVAAAVQAVVAGCLAFSPSRVSLVAAAGVNAAAVVAWGLSRTTGLPWPELLDEAEAVGSQDLAAAALAAAAALLAGVALLAPGWARATASPTALAGAACVALLAVAVPGMTAGHDHSAPSHDHGHPADEVAAPAHVDDGHGHDAQPGVTPSGPVISPDDVRLTSTERDAAQDLIDRTRDTMARFTDQVAVEASGYVSIGDQATGFEHFVNYGLLMDDRELDPDGIESIVMQVDDDGAEVVASAMYILSPGKTMDDVPDIAGDLTLWHDHQNLCWQGARVVGTTDAAGRCLRGTLWPTPPMLHVWMTAHPCGPFAGLEGTHGQGCDHDDH